MKTLWRKKKLLVLTISHFVTICFEKLSAAARVVYALERFKTSFSFIYFKNMMLLNPFPCIDIFGASAANNLFKTLWQNEQFLNLPQCFPLLVIRYPYNYRDFLFSGKICLTFFSNSSNNYSYFHYFLVDIFKVLCSRFAVCGKGLICHCLSGRRYKCFWKRSCSWFNHFVFSIMMHQLSFCHI